LNRKQKKQQEKKAKQNAAHEEKEQAKYQALVTRLEEGKPLTPKQISFAALHLTSITPEDKRDEDDYECENCGVLWSAYEHFDTKGKTKWSQCEGCELWFCHTCDISAHERECCDKAAQDGGDDSSDNAEDDNGEE
jgi:hypothetical protein